MSKRISSSRDPLDNPKGPKIRNLQFQDNKPAFLRNISAALSGQSSRGAPEMAADGRPAIPTRPDGGSEDEASEEDEWDLGRGDEAPAVVVLKEGKHIGREEVDRLRGEAKSSGASDPLSTADSASSAKASGSLSFSSGTSSKSKPPAGAAGGKGDWADVLKGAAGGKESEVKRREEGKKDEQKPKLSKEELAKQKEKAEKKKAKEKKEAKKKIANFDDE
ncbi:hypothetical protein JCM10213_004986 [Rhodosporidiobolus nylandii]